MSPSHAPDALLERSLRSGRVHSAYLLSGPGDAPRDAALRFARALVCASGGPRPCEACRECRRSSAESDVAIDGSGRAGPLLRHVGDHPDLLWVERGPGDTRVRIAQIRALRSALRLRSSEGGRRAAVIADAEWLNQEAQNALLRLLEEPPPATTLVLVAATAAGLLATVRSRCQRVAFPRPRQSALSADAPEEVREVVSRLERIAGSATPELLDWAEQFRGPRAIAAAAVTGLLETASAWLRECVVRAVEKGDTEVRAPLEAFRTLAICRKALAQRNANPQMVAERALFAVRNAGLVMSASSARGRGAR